MKVLLVHNRYQERGGEDAVFESERDALMAAGHELRVYERSNAELAAMPLFAKFKFALWDARWSRKTYDEVTALAREFRPDVAHVHNPYLMMTPSLYDALRDAGVPVVQTIHNYRAVCCNGLLYREGDVCETCLRQPSPVALLRRCWRGSLFQTAVFMSVQQAFRGSRVFAEKVDRIVALSEFSKRKLIEAGLPAEKTTVKPNFVDAAGAGERSVGVYAVCIGRLADYKGIKTLVAAYEAGCAVPLHIVGDGPLEGYVRERLGHLTHVRILGRLSGADALRELSAAAFLVFPSECYENMPRTIVEAFACGVPVLASDRGASAEMLAGGRPGLCFAAGDAASLAQQMAAMAGDAAVLERMGAAAAAEYREKYTKARNIPVLESVYAEAIKTRSAK